MRVFLQMAGYFYRREARLQEQLQEMRFEIIQNPVTKKVEELAKSSDFLELERKIFQIIESLKVPDELQA